MNLAKHDPETDMDMNMTPMIDVVFLLIIFFMIITDLTQQDLEELVLPPAVNAHPDQPDPEEWRPIVNIPYDGRMVVKREVLYDPERDDALPDPYHLVKRWLGEVARKMEPDEDDPTLPGEAVLIRADQSTSFKHIQKLMEFCGIEGVQIWKIQFAAAEVEQDEPPE